jgi:hypothetical protein
VETYVVRVWSADESMEPASDRRLRGVARRVRTGRETMFASWEELRGILTEASAEAASLPKVGPGEGKA